MRRASQRLVNVKGPRYCGGRSKDCKKDSYHERFTQKFALRVRVSRWQVQLFRLKAVKVGLRMRCGYADQLTHEVSRNAERIDI